MLLLPCVIPLSTGQPARDHMIGRFVAILCRDLLQRIARRVELAKTQRGRSEIQLALQIPRAQSSDLSAPGNGVDKILLFGGVRQDGVGSQ